jgi:uncharacterized protein
MRILIDLGHPGHVHFYKHVAWQLQAEGHELLMTARLKDVTLDLVKHYGFPHVVLTSQSQGLRGMIGEYLTRSWKLLSVIRMFKPDVVTEITGTFIALACWLTRKPSLVFLDSEPLPLDRLIIRPLATTIFTPECFLHDLGRRQVRYAGYHELAYLHPDYFTPDPSVLDELGVQPDEPYSVLRFVAWKATHDIGHSGFSPELKRQIVKKLSEYGRVFITSETPLVPELEPYRITVPPHRIHDVLYYARLFMGDGATMATEAGILGTPSVRASSLALNMGNFVELMERYQLVYSFYNPLEALQHACQFMQNTTTKTVWQERSRTLFQDKIDVTEFVSKQIKQFART